MSNTSSSTLPKVGQEPTRKIPFVPIYDFMMGDGLRLTGLPLLLFALIFSFWVAGKTLWASNQSVADRLGHCRESVCRALKDLLDRKLIGRIEGHSPKSGAVEYTIDESTMCEKVTGWCDLISQLGVTFPHNELCDTITGGCDFSPHNILYDNKAENKGESWSPLPHNCAGDSECERLWGLVVGLPGWRGRSSDAMAEAAKVLERHPVPVCREMLRHTVEGGYPAIYPPNADIYEKAKATCDKKSHHQPQSRSKSDDEVFRALRPLLPQDLKPAIFDGPMGQRGLRFAVDPVGKVIITCPSPVREWLESIPDTLAEILPGWAGESYSGYTFIV